MAHRKRVAVFTSGGDSQGMNAAVRSIVNVGVERGCDVFVITEGYQGMVDGGDKIQQLRPQDVSRILHRGGTVFGTARCMEFMTKEGRLKAARNLMKHRIDGLICIGGDGSLTGADLFRQEWGHHLDVLVKEGMLTQTERELHARLNIVGIAGSIDNDLSGTDWTIGANSALHRIIEAIDAIIATAASHQRTFIVEVMGRHCGYLALMAGLAVGADFVFLPEFPPEKTWPADLLEILHRAREAGKRQGIIVLSEGAVSREGTPITSENVRATLAESHIDARITVLGHVQRGGTPSAFDRMLATMSGAEAIAAVLDPNQSPCLIGLVENNIVRQPLMECVRKTKLVTAAMKEGRFEEAMKLRGGDFSELFRQLRFFRRPLPPTELTEKVVLRIGVICVGAPASGINAAIRAAVLYGREHGHSVLGINNGFEGLVKDDVCDLKWADVSEIVSRGGSILGTNRDVPDDFGTVAKKIALLKLSGLILIGGFEAFRAAVSIDEQKQKHPQLAIPTIVLPATISNNVPGTRFSVGCDTALNVICEAGDRLKQSGDASRRRVFILETQGKNCGYLATMGALVLGAEWAYTPEDAPSLESIRRDRDYFLQRFSSGQTNGLVVVNNECSSDTYTTAVLAQLYDAEGKGAYQTATCVLGYLQQGGDPSPLDRVRGQRLATECIRFLETQALKHTSECSLVGFQGNAMLVTPVAKLKALANFSKRKQTTQWWAPSGNLVRTLAKL